MYTTFYNLERRPFEKNGGPAFLWLSEANNRYFENLYTGVVENQGLLVLTGARGLGKTTIIEALVRSLQNEALCGVVTGALQNRIDFYNGLSRAFSLDKVFTTKVQFLLYFGQFLHEVEAQKKKILLIVDDCHGVTQDLLEEMRSLLNVKKSDGTRLLNILFVGEREFTELLQQPINLIIGQQVAQNCELLPLVREDVGNYIGHRLKIAGCKELLFGPDALDSIYLHTDGFPGKINTLCDHSLLIGADQGRARIDSTIVEQATQPQNVARVTTNTASRIIAIKQVEEGGGDEQRTDPSEKIESRVTFTELFAKIKDHRLVKMGGGFLLFAILYFGVYNLPFDEPKVETGRVTGSLSEKNTGQVVDKRVADVSIRRGAVQLTARESEFNSVAAKRTQESLVERIEPSELEARFWKARENDRQLIKVNPNDVEDFVEYLKAIPEIILLVRGIDLSKTITPGKAVPVDSLALKMQTVLLAHGFDPAQIKLMKPGEDQSLEVIADIAHQEGNQVMELIVAADGLWWGELTTKL